MNPHRGTTKAICKYGHDTRIVGRDSANYCRECKRCRGRGVPLVPVKEHQGLYYESEPRPEIEERMELQAHLLEPHGVWMWTEDLDKLVKQHEWCHRFEAVQG